MTGLISFGFTNSVFVEASDRRITKMYSYAKERELDMHSRRIFLIAAAIFVALCCTQQSYVQAGTKLQRLFYYNDTESAFRDLRQHIDQITILAPTAFNVDAEGVVWGAIDPRAIDLAEKHKVEVMPLIHNAKFNQALLHKLMTNPASIKRMLSTLVDVCKLNNFVGIQFDFEDLNVADKDLYTNMCREASQALHAHGLEFSVAIVGRASDFAGPTEASAHGFENWSGGYDLGELAKVTDFVTVMAYGKHGKGIIDVIKYALKSIPPNKLSVGIPLFSKYWSDGGKRTSLNYESAMGLVDRYKTEVRWDSTDGVDYAVFHTNGSFQYMYVEDARGFAYKRDLYKRYNLLGFSAFTLGLEDPKIWQILK